MGILVVKPAGLALCRLLGVGILCMALQISTAFAQDAVTLKAQHTALRSQLVNNPFKRPLYLSSTDQSGALHGDVYATVDQPYAVLGPALQNIAHWCDILILHLNVKRCQVARTKPVSTLNVDIGRKFEQPIGDAYLFKFQYQAPAPTADYFQITLSAPNGPLGTRHYQIMLEAVQLDSERSFIHLAYSYDSGATASLALQSYLATLGRDKVGFTITGHQASGEPIYVGGKRGVIERNTMRYYLAIEAYLGALSAPPQQQIDQRLNDWHDGVERYPRQLHELERGEYLAMKHREIERQNAANIAVVTE